MPWSIALFDNFNSQLKQLEEAREAELEDVQEVTGEFTRRIADSEKKFQMVLREKDALKKTLQDLELGKRFDKLSCVPFLFALCTALLE